MTNTTFPLQALSSSTYDAIFSNNKKYGGWFSKNLLPQKLEEKFYFVNMADSDDPNNPSGSHWVCIYNCYKHKHVVIYIDSFGLPPPTGVLSRMRKVMKRSGKRIIMPDLHLQDMSSSACGWYTIFFIKELLNGKTISNIVMSKLNPLDPIENEKILEEWVQKTFSKPITSTSNMQNFYKKLGKGSETLLYNNYCHALVKVPFRMLIIGQSGSGKTNALFNIIQNIDAFDRVYLFAKDIEEPLYAKFIECMKAIENKVKAKVITYSHDVKDLPSVDSIDKSRSNLIVFDDMVTLSSKDQSGIADFFVRARKKNCSCIYISQSYYGIPKLIRANSNYLVMKSIASKKDLNLILREMDLGVSPDKLVKLYNHALSKGMENFFMIDLTSMDKRFRVNFKAFNPDKISTIDSSTTSTKGKTNQTTSVPQRKSVAKVTFKKDTGTNITTLNNMRSKKVDVVMEDFEKALLKGVHVDIVKAFRSLLALPKAQDSGLQIDHVLNLLTTMKQHRDHIVFGLTPAITKDQYLDILASIYNHVLPGTNWKSVLNTRVYSRQLQQWQTQQQDVHVPVVEPHPVPPPPVLTDFDDSDVDFDTVDDDFTQALQKMFDEVVKSKTPVSSPLRQTVKSDDFESKTSDESKEREEDEHNEHHAVNIDIPEAVPIYQGLNVDEHVRQQMLSQVEQEYLIQIDVGPNQREEFLFQGEAIPVYNDKYITVESALHILEKNSGMARKKLRSKFIKETLQRNGYRDEGTQLAHMLENVRRAKTFDFYVITGYIEEVNPMQIRSLLERMTDSKIREVYQKLYPLNTPRSDVSTMKRDIQSFVFPPHAVAHTVPAGSGFNKSVLKGMINKARKKRNRKQLVKLVKLYNKSYMQN